MARIPEKSQVEKQEEEAEAERCVCVCVCVCAPALPMFPGALCASDSGTAELQVQASDRFLLLLLLLLLLIQISLGIWSATMLLLLRFVVLTVSFTCGGSFPSYRYDGLDDEPSAFDYDRAAAEELHMSNASACERCAPELCPPARGCRAGLVRDSCGCCLECGNLEGQPCDPGDRNVHHGLCGEGLACESDGGTQEPVCACAAQQPLCGSDGRTYMNLCRYKEAAFSKPGLASSQGPCRTVPIIKVPPRNLVNVTGSSAVFLCEVFAFPMALVEWRKEGKEDILPGDDPHISVQSRGGPQKYELSSWLQIEDATRVDSGTYRCIAKNSLGNVSSTVVLGILPPDEMSAYLEESMKESMGYDPIRDYDGDYY